MGEIWKDIAGYEGLYQVSNVGRVRSLKRSVFVRNRNKYKTLKGSIKTGCYELKNGYHVVSLYKDGIGKRFFTHRLVAVAFLENPLNLPQVNHKDENKKNNSVDNLEWCDAKYNTNYGDCIKRRARAQTNRHGAISVIQYSLHGDMIAEYPSLMEASRKSNVPVRAICACCKNYQKSSYGL